MATYLDRIVAAHRDSAAADPRPLEPLLQVAAAMPAGRPFSSALTAGEDLAVIAEIKRRSPSCGDLAPALVPADLAREYQAGGAAALSVLTDAEFFGGSAADLAQARSACELPVLRKDFAVDPRDVVDARLMGADAVLVIVAALDDVELRELMAIAAEVRLEALVEVHDEAEVGRALAAGATLVGVNQRDLSTFAVDRSLARRLRPHLGAEVVAVAESGIADPEDAADLALAGYSAILVGEALVCSSDPAAAVRALCPSAVRP